MSKRLIRAMLGVVVFTMIQNSFGLSDELLSKLRSSDPQERSLAGQEIVKQRTEKIAAVESMLLEFVDVPERKGTVGSIFAVAETGEIDRYRAALAEISQWDQHLVIAAPYHIDLLAAHALELGGKKNEASMLVRRWSNNADARLYIPKFWASIPNGGDVIDTWNRFRDPAGAQ